jgi:hypothetical protein
MPWSLKQYSLDARKSGFLTVENFRTTEKLSSSLVSKLRDDKGCKIVVLGDSFVWGAGMNVNHRWPSILQSKIGNSCTVYPMGKNGWSTYEYFGFYEKFLIDIEFDFLIVGIVSNDPNPRGSWAHYNFPTPVKEQVLLRSNANEIANFIGIPKLVFFRKYLVSYQYFDQIFKASLDRFSQSHGSLTSPPIVTYGFTNWENRLYESDIFDNWVEALKLFNKTSKHNLGFLLTPTSNSSAHNKIFSEIEDVMKKNNFIFQATSSELDNLFDNKLRPRTEWANLGDSHPGISQSNLFAIAAVKLLRTLGLKL